MSATTILVPISEPEARTLLAGGTAGEAAVSAITERAATLRSRVAVVDAVREELHNLLFERWADARAEKPPSLLARLTARWRPAEPPRLPTGYDPLVHLFGRSLPAGGADARGVAERIRSLVAMDNAAFREAIAADLGAFDPRAPAVFEQAFTRVTNPGVGSAMKNEALAVERALGREPPDAKGAYDAVVRLAAWSRPIWRLDGEMLGALMQAAALPIKPERAGVLFDEAGRERPALAAAVEKLPEGLPSFSGAGGYLSAAAVKLCAPSLRGGAGKAAQSAASSADDPPATLRNLRLLAEAILYCEAENLGLAEAAGVEWHDRKPIAA